MGEACGWTGVDPELSEWAQMVISPVPVVSTERRRYYLKLKYLFPSAGFVGFREGKAGRGIGERVFSTLLSNHRWYWKFGIADVRCPETPEGNGTMSTRSDFVVVGDRDLPCTSETNRS